MDRQAKIEFLKGLKAGTRSVREILTPEVIEFYQIAEDADAYRRATDGEVFTYLELEQLQEHSLKRNQFFTLYVHCDIPISQSEEDVIQ